MVLFEAGFWKRMMAIAQGCVSGALLFHKAVCSLKYLDEFCLASSRQNSQKSNVMQEGSNNQNDCSCQHSGEIFNFVGSKLKARASGWLSGAWSFPCMGLKEDVVALELCSAPQQQTWHSQQGPCQHCIAKSEQSSSRAQLSLRAESRVSCASWCCSTHYKAPSSAMSHHHHPKNLNSALMYCSMQHSLPYDQINSQCAAYVDYLSPLSIVQTMCVCMWESGMHCLGSQPRQSCHLQVCSTANGLHHFQMRDDTELNPLYKSMVCMKLHLWSWALQISSNSRYSMILCRA